MARPAINVSLSKTKGHLVFSSTTFDELGMESGRKIAFLQISPDYDPDEVLAKAKTLNWEMFGDVDTDGICQVRKVVEEIVND